MEELFMRKLGNHAILLALSLIMFTIFVSCSSKQSSQNTFDVEQFVNEMKAKNYSFELQDVEKSFLPTTRKRMIIGKETIDIYLYDSNKKAQKDAKRIDSDGCGYSNGTKAVKVSWVSYPHFYKKGDIIVQYVGTNESIISDLKELLGEQFAGYK